MKKYYLLAAAATMFAACSSDESVDNSGPVAAQVTASIYNDAETRAIDQAWSSNDAIGVMATNVSGTTSGVTSQMVSLYKNVKYTVTSGGNTGTFTAKTGSGIFFQDANETVTFAAYYPYQTSNANADLPGTNGVITGGKTNEKNGSSTDQETIDFLFASGATASKSSPKVEFKGDNQFKHKMARLILKVQMGTSNGFAATDISKISKITLGGLIHEGTFDVTKGTATANTSASAVSNWDITNVAKTETDNVDTYTMILYPQTLNSALPIAITVKDDSGSQTYSNSTTIKPDLKDGTSYEYTITVKKTGLEISGCTIAAWNSGTGANGDATL